VAATPIARGGTIDASQLRIEHIPARFVPPNPVGSISQAAGRVALAGLAPGEAVTDTRLARVRAGPVASLTPEGLRAFAVPVSLPPGEVAAGDHVDVLATYTTGAPHTETVVPAAQVLMVLRSAADERGLGVPGGASSGAGGAATSLVLLVSPADEDRLAYAIAFARLSVAVVPA
jgi:Flp pilus assembly protein CpaB